MNFEQHCRASETAFGKRYERIHRWLDEFASLYEPSERHKHRKFRHHKEGIEEAGIIFGDIGALVAEHHIKLDNEGKVPSKKDYEIPEYT